MPEVSGKRPLQRELTCSVADCDRPAHSRNMCERHGKNLRVYGHAVPVSELPLTTRVEQVGWDLTPTGCWEWRGKRHMHGYGLITARRHGLLNARAHRLMYELFVGPIPEGQVVRHKCDNPPCVNPDHLAIGTKADNSRDMVDRGRSGKQPVCGYGHDLSGPDGRTTTGDCRECQRRRGREYMRRRRASA